MKNNSLYKSGRRIFLSEAMKIAGSACLLTLPGAGIAKNLAAPSLTVQEVINLILESIPTAPFTQTVDTIKAGDANQAVTGIVTTMFATATVIEKTAKIGANFIIAHEPTFYNHSDDVETFENDEVYRYKRDLLKRHQVAVWRFHDYIHAQKPDGVMMGVLQALGWEKYYNPNKPKVVTIPPTPMEKIVQLVKNRLGIAQVKVIGKGSALCSTIAIAPGAAGGPRQIEAVRKEKPDLFICGELNEWETSEYIRDLQYFGAGTGLIVLGHIVSEEPGLQWLATWLQPQLPGIKVTHIPSGDAFTWM